MYNVKRLSLLNGHSICYSTVWFLCVRVCTVCSERKSIQFRNFWGIPQCTFDCMWTDVEGSGWQRSQAMAEMLFRFSCSSPPLFCSLSFTAVKRYD